MRKLGFVLLCVFGLCGAGEPPPMDMSALQQAIAAYNQKSIDCRSFRGPIAVCRVSALRAFALVAKIRDPKPLQTYARRLRKADKDLAADNIGQGMAESAYGRAEDEFFDQIANQQDAYTARHTVTTGPAYDAGTLDRARTMESQAIQRCERLWQHYQAQRYECYLSAAREFAVAIKMRDMYRLDTFALKVHLSTSGITRSEWGSDVTAPRYEALYNQLFAFTGDKFSGRYP